MEGNGYPCAGHSLTPLSLIFTLPAEWLQLNRHSYKTIMCIMPQPFVCYFAQVRLTNSKCAAALLIHTRLTQDKNQGPPGTAGRPFSYPFAAEGFNLNLPET
jgi:hypothetical protein